MEVTQKSIVIREIATCRISGPILFIKAAVPNIFYRIFVVSFSVITSLKYSASIYMSSY